MITLRGSDRPTSTARGQKRSQEHAPGPPWPRCARPLQPPPQGADDLDVDRRTDDRPPVDDPEAGTRRTPLVCAAAVLTVFVLTVIVLAVKAGASVAMLTTIFVIVMAATACGLWGTAMAVRETHHHGHALTDPITDEHLAAAGIDPLHPTRRRA